MSHVWWRWGRRLGAAAILAVLVRRLGAAPFADALGRISGPPVAAVVGIAVLTTACCAWRWQLVARGLGVRVPLPAAIAAYYRSQLLNSTLPGGVLGDVHRAVHHGRSTGDVALNLRAVGWERFAGQLVQGVLTLVVLLAFPSPVRSSALVVAVAAAVGVAGMVLARRLRPAGSGSRLARLLRSPAHDIRHGLLAPRAWPGVVLASTLVVAGHAATFLIAARAAGVTASTARLLPLLMVILLAASLPTNVGGWGPREGMAAWAFAAAGLGATRGVTTAVVYGVLALVACLPGVAVVIADGLRRSSPGLPVWRTPATRGPQGAANG